MASKSDVRAISDDGTVSKQRRFDERDFDYIAEYVYDEYHKRKEDREDLERVWNEIDRQVRMEPDIAYKLLPNGKPDTRKSWMSEVELPLQAQALEVLRADASRLMIPDTGLFFRAHAETTDEYLQRVNFQSLIHGDETEVPTHINQDNADKLVEGFLCNLFDQGEFRKRLDRINTESFKYGMGLGRARMETKNVFIHEARGVRKETQKLPVLVPMSIRNTYLDDPRPSTHSAQVLGESHITVDNIRFENLVLAASKGSNDPEDQEGGWRAAALKKLVADKDGYVKLLEMEGDLIVPRKTTRSFVIPGAIVTVALGGKEQGDRTTRAVIRLRFRKYPFSSYLLFPYQYEGAHDVYPTSPLMKGRPLQILATDAANRTLDSAALKIAPPVGWDSSDKYFAKAGGPKVAPHEKWESIDPKAVVVHSDIGGDPAVMSAMMTQAFNLYAELTGVLPGRLGAQTVSHTTAYAKDAELQRGAVRTVNYVNASGQGPMVRWLDMAYQMGRDSIDGKISFYIYDYNGYVQVEKEHLPDTACFEWLGAGGPKDKSQQMQEKVNGLLLASKLDAINAQTQKPMRIDYNKAIDQILRETGWSDLDAIINQQSGLAAAQVGPGPAVAALQNLQQQLPQ
jgi:hypothetical protein